MLFQDRHQISDTITTLWIPKKSHTVHPDISIDNVLDPDNSSSNSEWYDVVDVVSQVDAQPHEQFE